MLSVYMGAHMHVGACVHVEVRGWPQMLFLRCFPLSVFAAVSHRPGTSPSRLGWEISKLQGSTSLYFHFTINGITSTRHLSGALWGCYSHQFYISYGDHTMSFAKQVFYWLSPHMLILASKEKKCRVNEHITYLLKIRVKNLKLFHESLCKCPMYRIAEEVTYYIRVTYQRFHMLLFIFLTSLKLSYVKTSSTELR